MSSTKPAPRHQLLQQPLAARARTGPGVRAAAARRGRARRASARRPTTTGSPPPRVHAAVAKRPPGRSTRRISRSAASGSARNISPQRHSTASCDAASTSMRLDVDLLEAHAVAPRPPRARCAGRQHLRREVRQDQLAAGLDELVGHQPDLARPGRQLEHLRARAAARAASSIHAVTGIDASRIDGRVLLPAVRDGAPALAGLRAEPLEIRHLTDKWTSVLALGPKIACRRCRLCPSPRARTS